MLAVYLLQVKGMSGATLHNTKALRSRTSTRCGGLSKKRAQGTQKRDGSAKTKRSSALARIAASKKAARTRRRRATVLKTLKTGEESFNMKE